MIDSYFPLESGRFVAISASGDYVFLNQDEVDVVSRATESPDALKSLDLKLLADLYAKHFLPQSAGVGMQRLLQARIRARNETLRSGASLHLIVPTLECEHSCKYCQVSRAVSSEGYSMTLDHIEAVANSIFESTAQVLTVEFQGGDPLLRFDLVKAAIDRIANLNKREKRKIKFVVASTLHQLSEEMCAFFKEHEVALSTSIDGPAVVHNRNRPIPTRDSYERTIRGLTLAREKISPDCVSALMTVTRESLPYAQEIVDEYVRLGLDEIFIRPLAMYGFAKKNAQFQAYAFDDFERFYAACLDRIFWWNQNGYSIREAGASIWMNKLLSPFDSGYMDLQSESGAGSACVLYNYDGWIYPSDEARMLAEVGDKSLRLNRIGCSLMSIAQHSTAMRLQRESNGKNHEECAACTFNVFCGPDLIELQSSGNNAKVASTWHCRRSKSMFGWILNRLDLATEQDDNTFIELAHAWARRQHPSQRKSSDVLPNRAAEGGTPRGSALPRIIPIYIV